MPRIKKLVLRDPVGVPSSCCTTRSVRIYPWRRIRRSRAPSSGPGTFFAAQFSAGCTTNISGFDLRQAQGWRSNGRQLLVDPANEIASRDIPHEQEQTVSHLVKPAQRTHTGK